MRTTVKSEVSAVTIPRVRAPRRRRFAAHQGSTPTGPVPEGAYAQRATAWLESGKPQAEIGRDDAVPAQSKADLEKFRPSSYRNSHAH